MSTWTQSEQRTLLGIARDAIRAGVGGAKIGRPSQSYPNSLRSIRSSFVTLKLGENLRGCIGTIHPFRALVEDIHENAFAAAFGDPRFPPLRADEMARLHISISVLSPFTELRCLSRAELTDGLRPKIDGLFIEQGNRKAIFLPSVWDVLDDPERFLSQLMRKAGFEGDYWSPSLKTMTYTVHYFEDSER
jgi:hypothetical protein